MHGFGKLYDENDELLYEGYFENNEFEKLGIMYNRN